MNDLSFRLAALPTSVVAIAMLSLGIAVISREKGSKISYLFLIMTSTVAIWLTAFSFMFCSTNASSALFWARIGYVGIPFIPAAVHHFQSALLRQDRAHHLRVALVWLVSLAFAITLAATPLMLEGVYEYSWGFYPRLNPAGLLFLLWFGGVLLVTMQHYRTAYRDADSEEQKELLRSYMIAFGVGYAGVIDYLPSFGVRFYPFGFLAIAGFLTMAARIIWRYQLVELTPAFAATKILETMQGAVLVVDLEGNIRVANRAAAALLGVRDSEIVGMHMSNFIESPLNFGNASDTLMRGQTIRDRAMLWRRKDGERMELGVSASLLRDDHQIPVGIVYIAIDISDRRRAEQIEFQAYHDALTGLPNRILFRKRLDAAIEDFPARARVVAVMFLDLDGFKLINDSLGHSVGDELLQAVARRLKGAVRDDDLVARLGGDEFTLLLNLREATDNEIVAQKILAAVNQPYILDGHEVFISTSIGVAIHPNHGEDAEALLKNADMAMYLAKELGKNNFQLCGPAIARRAMERLSLESRLRRALELDEFVVQFQPVVNLQSNRVTGAEALVRWQRDRRLVGPQEFIAVAEETRLILSIGEWVMTEACRQAQTWQQEGAVPIYVAVNLSVVQLHHPGFLDVVRRALDISGLDPSRLLLEITESAAMQNVEHTVTLLQELKSLGVSIAIDDFGTGFSSLSYLNRFPIDIVKIDRSFIQGTGQPERDAAIVAAIIAMAHALHMSVIAEGVETWAQVEILRSQGCNAVQGFLFSSSVSASEMSTIARDGLPRPVAQPGEETERRRRLVI